VPAPKNSDKNRHAIRNSAYQVISRSSGIEAEEIQRIGGMLFFRYDEIRLSANEVTNYGIRYAINRHSFAVITEGKRPVTGS